jgi:hypothetical protein
MGPRIASGIAHFTTHKPVRHAGNRAASRPKQRTALSRRAVTDHAGSRAHDSSFWTAIIAMLNGQVARWNLVGCSDRDLREPV